MHRLIWSVGRVSATTHTPAPSLPSALPTPRASSLFYLLNFSMAIIDIIFWWQRLSWKKSLTGVECVSPPCTDLNHCSATNHISNPYFLAFFHLIFCLLLLFCLFRSPSVPLCLSFCLALRWKKIRQFVFAFTTPLINKLVHQHGSSECWVIY